MNQPNAGDRKSVRAAEKAALLALTQRQDVIRQIMATVPGRSWMHERLASVGVFAQTFTGDPLTSAFNEGRRSSGLQDLSDVMSACPDNFILMMREANERSAAAAQRPSSANGDGGDQGRGDDDSLDNHRDEAGNPAFDGYEGQDRFN